MSNTLASMAYSEIGEIQTVSLQGSQIFVVVRLVGETLSDMMGNPVQCGQYLVGIPKGAPEHTATMAELLIPINMTYATQISDPKFLIRMLGLYLDAPCLITDFQIKTRYSILD